MSVCQRWIKRFLVRLSGRFDPGYYLGEYPDVAVAGVDPLSHYCEFGWREARRPGPMVHPAYIANTPIGLHFPGCNPILVWMLLGRWVGWSLAWPELQGWKRRVGRRAPTNNKADIVLVLHETTRTGAPIFALMLARWWQAAGRNLVILLVADGALLPDFWRDFDCVPLFCIASRDRHAYLRDCLGDKRGVLYINSVASCRVWPLLGGWRGGVVLHVHEGPEGIAQHASAIAVLASAAPEVIAVNDSASAPLAVLLGRRAKVLPPAIMAARGAVFLDGASKREKPLILGCGTESRRKGADLFCQIAAILRDARAGDARGEVEFCWIGGPGDVDMAALVRFYGLEDRFRLTGEVADPLPLIAQATALMLPSREDPFPLVALEAASCGVPIVCFDTMAQGVGTWVSQGAGQMVRAFDREAMAGALARMLSEPLWHKAASERAWRAAQEFDIERIAPQIETIMGKLRYRSGHQRSL
jgi:glycosyltransferase involved in cell wall biosynthesis